MTEMMTTDHGGWMWGGMWFFSLLFWILIIAGVVLFVRWVMGRSESETHHTSESPLDILKRRYAKGEIDQETFEKMKRDIGGKDS